MVIIVKIEIVESQIACVREGIWNKEVNGRSPDAPRLATDLAFYSQEVPQHHPPTPR